MPSTGLDPTLEYFTMKLLQTNMKLSEEKHKKYEAVKVFVIFNEETAQRSCLEHMCVGEIPAMLDATDKIDPKYLFDGNLLAIKEAPEPSSILYENLENGLVVHAKEQLISWAVLSVGLVLTWVTVSLCFQKGQPLIGAVLISFWNSVLPIVNKILVKAIETHHTLDDQENSFIQKTVAARGFCSALILYLVGLEHSSNILSPYYIGTIEAVLLADAITTPIVRAMDIGGLMNRYVFAPIAGTDARAKALAEGTDYMLSERYTDLAKTVLMSLFFSAIFPVGYLYSALACFLSYWVDKFCILRVFRQKPTSGDKLVRVTRLFCAIIILVHAVITAHFYYSWPFDNLCPKKVELTAEGKLRAEAIGADTTTVYQECDSVSEDLLPPVQKEAWFQPDGKQFDLVFFYQIVAIITMCYIFFTYMGSSSYGSIYSLFWYKHTAVGETQGISFDTVESGEGYVPQIAVPGLSHPILACVAPKAGNEGGGLEFHTYLLNWTASRERTGDEAVMNEDGSLKEDTFQDYTEAEKDGVYRKDNFYFDEQLEGIDEATKNSGLFSHAKQYIFNKDTAEAGEFRMSVAGKALARDRASTIRSSLQEGGAQLEKTAGAAKSWGAAKASANSTWDAQRAAAASASAGASSGDISLAVVEKPADLSGLEALADASGEPELEFPSTMKGGGF